MAKSAVNAADSEAVLIRIRAALPSLRPSERRIAQVFVDSPSEGATLSVAELADRCETSTTSVVRFYKRMGYSHYKDLLMDLTREAMRQEMTTSSLPPVSGDIGRNDSLDVIVAKVAINETLSISDTARSLDTEALGQAVTLITGSRRIDTFGMGAGSLVGLDLQQKLSRVGRTVINWSDPHSAWTAAATLDSSCVAIAISHSGRTGDTVDFLTVARESGAATIAITNFHTSPVASAADVVLTTSARESAFRSGALGSRIAQLMVVDCLFTAVAQASYDTSVEALRNTYRVVHDRSQGGAR
ncbi:MurR/RpiR family transcriptional regulator [Arthrobacter sp. B3I4]|uniref:MurR/RpiR family transcriptional regulator n=1 Tax=Arthrobacter sp. B3I4 TaxID=3042267 RepID=UPI0027809233|nr:MurR/RpiR family transcriptional regulator [Arthrobacter sp. B3I4]MDQ0755050.1 DNA-binding MurR/RpiR family transcriptional regulator [Arthrobacter sp. B3I4]